MHRCPMALVRAGVRFVIGVSGSNWLRFFGQTHPFQALGIVMPKTLTDCHNDPVKELALL
jgi:hypothetical protein